MIKTVTTLKTLLHLKILLKTLNEIFISADKGKEKTRYKIKEKQRNIRQQKKKVSDCKNLF